MTKIVPKRPTKSQNKTKLLPTFTGQLRLVLASRLFAQMYAFGTVVILVATTVFWSLLGARIEQGNADQLIDVHLFENHATFAAARFPGQHTLLLKWPLFFLVKMIGASPTSFMATTVGLSLVTVLALIYMVYRVEKRLLVFGTICLALASVLLLIPTQPYPGGILPVSMAMLTTRNIEYVVYIASLAMLVRSPRMINWRFFVSILLLGVLVASDKLFVTVSISGALMACVVYALRRHWSLVSMSVRWLVATVSALTGATVVLWLINFSRLTHVVHESGLSPYGFVNNIKGVLIAGSYAVLAVFSNFGANPANDTRLLKYVPEKIGMSLANVGGFSYLMNGIVLGFGIYAVVRLLYSSVARRKADHIHADTNTKLSLTLIWSTVAATGVFVLSDHYYPVDARYLAIALFSAFIAIATFTNKKVRSTKAVLVCGIFLLISIGLGIPVALREYNLQKAAIAIVDNRNQAVAQAISNHRVDTLVGDYWRVLPIKQADNQLNVAPLASCAQAAQILASENWRHDLQHKSFAYLLTFDSSLTGFHNCSLADVTREYGKPNASVVIDGSLDKPNELLLLYDQGAHPGSEKGNQPVSKAASTVEPILAEELPHATCRVPTVMNIVAHQDDDLLFLSPDLIKNLKPGHCVRTIYLTAGDAGADKFYWLSREQGSEAAYSAMLGTNDIWIQRIVKLADKQFITVANPRNNPNVSLIFMHLPDGNIDGGGFRASHNESLDHLEKGIRSDIQSVDGQSSYTSAQLTTALTTLMQVYQPAEINAQGDYTVNAAPDHSDHRAVGRYVLNAHMQYEKERFEGRITIPLMFYMGYPTKLLIENVSGADLATKTAAFLAYSKYDVSVCHSVEECNSKAVYGKYLKRQYTLTK